MLFRVIICEGNYIPFHLPIRPYTQFGGLHHLSRELILSWFKWVDLLPGNIFLNHTTQASNSYDRITSKFCSSNSSDCSSLIINVLDAVKRGTNKTYCNTRGELSSVFTNLIYETVLYKFRRS